MDFIEKDVRLYIYVHLILNRKMAKKDIVKLDEILRSLGMDPDISSFDSRLRIQKTVYILQAMGVDLKYPFEFYKGGHGVYSKELADDYYHIQERLNEEKPLNDHDRFLSGAEKKKLERFRKMGHHDLKMLEAVSSIIYLDLTYGYQEDVVERIRKIKPHLGHDITLSAQNNAKILLFNESNLTNEIKDEMKLWDTLNDSSNN